MGRFWRGRDRSKEAESRLRADRPEPRQELVRRITGEIRGHHRRFGTLRLGIAAGFTAMLLVALAAFGGLGFAASSVAQAAKATAVAMNIISPATPKHFDTQNSSARNQYQGPEQCRDKATEKYHRGLQAAQKKYKKNVARAKTQYKKNVARAKAQSWKKVTRAKAQSLTNVAYAKTQYKRDVARAKTQYKKNVAHVKTQDKADLAACR